MFIDTKWLRKFTNNFNQNQTKLPYTRNNVKAFQKLRELYNAGWRILVRTQLKDNERISGTVSCSWLQ